MRIATILTFLLLVPFAPMPECSLAQKSPGAASTPLPRWDPHGPYVNSVVFKVMYADDAQVAALLSGEIDHVSEPIASAYLDQLRACPDVELTFTEPLHYRFIAINCQRYPFSIPAFRRALAFAMDKRETAAKMWGEQGYPLDTPVPPSCGVWHNNATTPDFTISDVQAARAELAAAGFVDRDGDGYVEAPNGTSFTFRLEYIDFDEGAKAGLQAAKCHWDEAGLPVELVPMSMGPMLDRVYTIPRDYDGACHGYGLSEPNPLILENWLSSNIANPEGNELNWGNASYDAHIGAMLNATSFEAAMAAAHAAQQVIVQDCPLIVIGSYYQVTAHRTDQFEGWIDSPGYGTSNMNPWNPRKVRLVPGQAERDSGTGLGGTLEAAIRYAIDTQNPLYSTGSSGQWVLKQLYTSLIGDPDPRDHSVITSSGLATAWTTRELPQGLEFNFTLVNNATWHDGAPVTSADVAFSYNYIKNHRILTYYRELEYLNECAAVDATHVRLVTNGKSHWILGAVGNWVILPKHIWEGIVSPYFPNPEPVGCGPFKWGARVHPWDPDEYIRLDRWELYHYRIEASEPLAPPLPPLVYCIAGGILVIATTLISSFRYLRKQAEPKAPWDEAA